MKRFVSRVSIISLFIGMFAQQAVACSVCGVGKEEARTAYWATTAILSFLPLIMIGAVVYYLFKRNKDD